MCSQFDSNLLLDLEASNLISVSIYAYIAAHLVLYKIKTYKKFERVHETREACEGKKSMLAMTG